MFRSTRNKTESVLVTAAGGPAAIGFMKGVQDMEGIRIFAADMDRHAAGLYLVPPERRLFVPAGKDPNYADFMLDLCRRHHIRVLVPTADDELVPLSRRRRSFLQAGIHLAIPGAAALALCSDKLALLEALKGKVRTGRFQQYDPSFDFSSWSTPFVLKPRRGSGSRGITLVHDRNDLLGIPLDGSYFAQEYLPGEEYSVDSFCDRHANNIVAVPRVRLKQDSGVAVASIVRKDLELVAATRDIVELLRLRGVANTQFRRDAHGRPTLLEINPRFPGTVSLTVASGINIPEFVLSEILGRPFCVPESFMEIACVRYLSERLLNPSIFDAPESAATTAAALAEAA